MWKEPSDQPHRRLIMVMGLHRRAISLAARPCLGRQVPAFSGRIHQSSRILVLVFGPKLSWASGGDDGVMLMTRVRSPISVTRFVLLSKLGHISSTAQRSLLLKITARQLAETPQTIVRPSKPNAHAHVQHTGFQPGILAYPSFDDYAE